MKPIITSLLLISLIGCDLNPESLLGKNPDQELARTHHGYDGPSYGSQSSCERYELSSNDEDRDHGCEFFSQVIHSIHYSSAKLIMTLEQINTGYAYSDIYISLAQYPNSDYEEVSINCTLASSKMERKQVYECAPKNGKLSSDINSRYPLYIRYLTISNNEDPNVKCRRSVAFTPKSIQNSTCSEDDPNAVFIRHNNTRIPAVSYWAPGTGNPPF